MLMEIHNNKVKVNGRPVLFLCDRKRCETCSFPECSYTTDLNHAQMTGEKRFYFHGGSYWEDVKLAEVIDH